ncbi:MAG: hypothetical protein WDA13_03485 [Candidatus Shapirobacteria bacterium]
MDKETLKKVNEIKDGLGEKIPKNSQGNRLAPKTKITEDEKIKPGSTQERYTFSTDKGISKGSYMGDQQTLGLRQEVREGADDKKVTDTFNKRMKIVD